MPARIFCKDSTEAKLDKWGYKKLNICIATETIYNTKTQQTEWEKIFTDYSSA